MKRKPSKKLIITGSLVFVSLISLVLAVTFVLQYKLFLFPLLRIITVSYDANNTKFVPFSNLKNLSDQYTLVGSIQQIENNSSTDKKTLYSFDSHGKNKTLIAKDLSAFIVDGQEILIRTEDKLSIIGADLQTTRLFTIPDGQKFESSNINKDKNKLLLVVRQDDGGYLNNYIIDYATKDSFLIEDDQRLNHYETNSYWSADGEGVYFIINRRLEENNPIEMYKFDINAKKLELLTSLSFVDMYNNPEEYKRYEKSSDRYLLNKYATEGFIEQKDDWELSSRATSKEGKEIVFSPYNNITIDSKDTGMFWSAASETSFTCSYPSWLPDERHVLANCGGTVVVIDTVDEKIAKFPFNSFSAEYRQVLFWK